jgi:hypothetical protein
LWVAGLVAAAGLVSLVTVTVTGPRVSIRWQPHVTATDRLALERRHDLRNGRQDDPQNAQVWRYELGDRSRDAIAAIVTDPAVADTNYIDRSTYEAGDSTVTVATRLPAILERLPFPFSTDNRFESLWFLVHVQSLCLFLAGGLLLWSARLGPTGRRTLAAAALVAVAVTAYGLPLRPTLLRMADANMYTASRDNFERSIGRGEVNFENHLTLALLATTYPAFGAGQDAPERTFRAFSRAATAWFIVCALAIGVVERWSPHVVRYLALAMLAPSALLYYGHRDFAYLALNVAAFPLLARGAATGSKRLEAGSALAGLGAAFHGFGLLSLAGAWAATLTARAPILQRFERVLRIAAWGTAAWLGWLAIYMIALDLGVATGHASTGSWRPLFADERGSRLNVALLSQAGLRDLLVSGWVLGVPLVAVAGSLWKTHRQDVVMTLAYAIPSMLFWVFFWPVQGLAVDTGHVAAAFPAVYACAWLCAREPRHTIIAAAMLASAHLGFWRMVLDTRFVNWSLSP